MARVRLVGRAPLCTFTKGLGGVNDWAVAAAVVVVFIVVVVVEESCDDDG